MDIKGRTFGEQLYIHLLIFVWLEEPRTARELADSLAFHGIERDIRTVQRTLVSLKKQGFPIEGVKTKGHGAAIVWSWSETGNVLDCLLQAKSSACFKKTLA
jgi:hypothetical protein